jgi:hypothetical protein
VDISNGGWIVGTEVASTNKGFYVRNGNVSFVPKLPSSDALDDVRINGVNDLGAVTGGVRGRAIYWDGKSEFSRSLGQLTGGTFSQGHEVNDQDFVVGEGNFPVGNAMTTRAFIWHTDFGLYRLPIPDEYRNPSIVDCVAEALSNLNDIRVIQVVGWCRYMGKQKAVRWNVVVSNQQA